MIIRKIITLAMLEAIAASNPDAQAYYSSKTAWWTHNPSDLQVRGVGIPTDIFGAPLYQTDLKSWLETAKAHSSHYGVNGLTTFMAMHAQNFEPEIGEAYALFGQKDVFDKAVTAHLAANTVDPLNLIG